MIQLNKNYIITDGRGHMAGSLLIMKDPFVVAVSVSRRFAGKGCNKECSLWRLSYANLTTKGYIGNCKLYMYEPLHRCNSRYELAVAISSFGR